MGQDPLIRLPYGQPDRPSTRKQKEDVMVDLIVTIVVGGIIGWLASLIMKTSAQMGILANVIVGIIGSSLGFWLAGLLGLAVYGSIARWIVGVAGAALLIWLLKAVGIFK
jgi:uncharacterized membrane protein YeaQ/YmgE (transglycosylase-associated protein family)